MFMIKLKDYFQFEKMTELAKQQSIKYGQLYDQIEKDLPHVSDYFVNMGQYLARIEKDIINIENLDPDISHVLRESFQQYCVKHGVKFVSDIDLLQNLDIEVVPSIPAIVHIPVVVPITPITNIANIASSNMIDMVNDTPVFVNCVQIKTLQSHDK